MLVLVIDDDPDVGQAVTRSFPGGDVTVVLAHNGWRGLALARELRTQIDVVVLDIKMPYHGIHVAVQLRRELPGLRILPYSYARERSELFRAIGGMARLLPKPAGDELLRQRILEAAAMAPPPLGDDPLVDYLLEQARLEEVPQPPPLRIAALFSSMSLLRACEPALDATRNVCYSSTSGSYIASALLSTAIDLLLADLGAQETACALAQQHGLPLLLVAFTMADSYRALRFTPNVMLRLEDASRLGQALDSLRAGQPYVDPLISARLRDSGLSAGERAMIPFLLHGDSAATIAAALHLTENTIRKYSSHISAVVGHRSVGQLIAYLNRGDG